MRLANKTPSSDLCSTSTSLKQMFTTMLENMLNLMKLSSYQIYKAKLGRMELSLLKPTIKISPQVIYYVQQNQLSTLNFAKIKKLMLMILNFWTKMA